jgi:C1A family cysteine protease
MELKKVILIATTILIAFGIFKNSHNNGQTDVDQSYMPAFEQWIAKHNKAYTTPAEKNYRYSIFVQSAKRVEAHDPKSLYRVALNKFSDYTKEEFKIKHLGFRSNSGAKKNNVVTLPEQNTIPTNWNWNTQGAVTPIKDQGQCGACWTFSTTGSLEGAHFLKFGNLLSFSEQQLNDCSKDGNHGCNGGEMTTALTWVQNNGITLEQNYPYIARNQKCQTGKPAAYQINDWASVPQHSGPQLAQATWQQPVSLGIYAATWDNYAGGIYDDAACNG